MICAAHQTLFRRTVTENELGWACGTHDKRKAYKVLVWKPEETEWVGVERINLDLDRYTVRLLSFRTDCAERILCAPSGGHPQKHVGASLDTLCA